MTENALHRVAAYITSIIPDRPCPLCGHHAKPTFHVVPGIGEPVHRLALNMNSFTGANIPVILLMCPNCGNLNSLSAFHLGLVDETGKVIIPTEEQVLKRERLPKRIP